MEMGCLMNHRWEQGWNLTGNLSLELEVWSHSKSYANNS
jgi:hypothetical protein